MKLYSDHLKRDDLLDAARHADVHVVECAAIVGARVRLYGWKVVLSGSSNRPRNSGTYGGVWETPPATWDEHGHFFAFLFALDPNARLAHYDGADDFTYATKDAYPAPTMGRAAVTVDA